LSETETRPLEEVLGILVEKVEKVFEGFEAQRGREAEEKRRREEAAKRWEKERAEEAKRRAEEEKNICNAASGINQVMPRPILCRVAA